MYEIPEVKLKIDALIQNWSPSAVEIKGFKFSSWGGKIPQSIYIIDGVLTLFKTVPARHLPIIRINGLDPRAAKDGAQKGFNNSVIAFDKNKQYVATTYSSSFLYKEYLQDPIVLAIRAPVNEASKWNFVSQQGGTEGFVTQLIDPKFLFLVEDVTDNENKPYKFTCTETFLTSTETYKLNFTPVIQAQGGRTRTKPKKSPVVLIVHPKTLLKKPLKKSVVKKSVVKKFAVKKSVVKESAVKKSAVKKSAVKKSAFKKSAVKKSAFKKSAAKK